MSIREITQFCDTISEWSARAVAWLVWPVMGLCAYEVVTRRFFGSPHIWTYDVTSLLYSVHFMLLAAYTLLYKGHVAVDILSSHFSRRGQVFAGVLSYLLFFFPFMLVLFYVGMDSAIYSWRQWEMTPVGYPIIMPTMKTVTPVTALLLFIQGLSEFIKIMSPSAKGEEVQ
jgi:TRAP-type mannitol/chloroaromatic compound transport system permease small subunit